jgi:hypothetical protein
MQLAREGILVSNSVMRDYQKTFGVDSTVQFYPREVDLKSFGKETLYSAFVPGSRDTIAKRARVRAQLLAVRGFSPNTR